MSVNGPQSAIPLPNNPRDLPFSGQQFPPECRILRRGEFQAIARLGRREHTRNFVIVHRPSVASWARLGVTVSKKVAKQAVRRNRIKRLIREAFRTLPEDLRRRPFDLVVIARASSVDVAGGALLSEMQAALTRLLTGRTR